MKENVHLKVGQSSFIFRLSLSYKRKLFKWNAHKKCTNEIKALIFNENYSSSILTVKEE